ncbi:MAG: hypothetical protein ABL962_17070 [Fimbriimonadaceae bacterium]
MPKTYNARQIRQLELEARYAPKPPSPPDDLPHFRFFSHPEIATVVARIKSRVAAGKVTQLRPDTAYLAARALDAYMATPSREDIVREICGVRGGCDTQCLACIGKANAIMQLYDGITREEG